MWQTFGQSKAVALLQRSLAAGALAHAYLFVGPPHVGKETLALDLARALNCPAAGPPCGECVSCRRISEGKHADVRTVRLLSPMPDSDAPERTRISVRDFDEIEYAANLPPYEGSHKVFIIDGAENLSTAAANRLLKVLEEPLPHVVWLLLTLREARLLPTVISRCQRVELRPSSVPEVAAFLENEHRVDSATSALVARLSSGRIGWAIMAVVDSGLLQARSRELERLQSLAVSGIEERFQVASEVGAVIERDRKAGLEIMALWMGWWRDVMLVKLGSPAAVVNLDCITAIEACASELSVEEVTDTVRAIGVAMTEVERNVNARLALEVLMLGMKAGARPLPGSPAAGHPRPGASGD